MLPLSQSQLEKKLKMETGNNQTLRKIIAGAIIAATGLLVCYITVKASKDERKPQEKSRIGLVYYDKTQRQYAGKPRFYRGGAEQKVYVDKYPFGSLDGVITKQWSEQGHIGQLSERGPTSEETETFEMLEYYGKKEHGILVEAKDLESNSR